MVLVPFYASRLYLNFETAKYERIENGKRFYAEIKELRGVWATGKTRAECQKNLSTTLEDRIIFRLRHNPQIPYSFSF